MGRIRGGTQKRRQARIGVPDAAPLPDYERIRGPEHPETLITRHELAHWTREARARGTPSAD